MTNNIGTSSTAYEKALEDLKSNPFFDKYAVKIANLQQESPEELRQRLEENEKRKQKKYKTEAKERPYSVASEHGKRHIANSPFTKTKKLEDIMKTELLKDKSDEEIKQLWLDYHRDKDVVISVVPKDTYALMNERAKEFQTFLLPIPRTQGYEFIMCQFAANEVHFTPLIAYQTHKENAPECLTLTFYPDLQDEKGIVLMKGEYDTDILNCQEAQCLVNELQLYYSQNNEKRLNLLRRFTYSPSEFNHMDLIAELETLSI
ncbi:hypothetical protein RUM44_000592 [Polyplax serrata]|uniref:ATP synthase mitochondrial F1 complex assembly factor 1 n=1 Tax=Polyplax serrata TaxID=468196 RepID=A0ABR1B5X1_POLSC